MFPQIACLRRGIVTLVAFVRLFSTVCFQMCPQFVCPRWCEVTLVAFVLIFPTVRFQMCPQMASLNGCKVTLVAFVWLFSTVRFQMCPQMACIGRCIFTLVACMWHDIVSIFRQDFHIWTLQTKVIIFKSLFHCHCVWCFAQMMASNWVRIMIDFWSIITNVGKLSLFQNWVVDVWAASVTC